MKYHPSVFIKNEMNSRGWNEEELAKRLDMSLVDTKLLLDKRIWINDDYAEKLAKAFGTSKDLWINLQEIYYV